MMGWLDRELGLERRPMPLGLPWTFDLRAQQVCFLSGGLRGQMSLRSSAGASHTAQPQSLMDADFMIDLTLCCFFC
jgi:hypothetical protein